MVTINSPQDEIYREVFRSSHSLGYKTYDFLPAKDASYPFVYIGEQWDADVATKSVIYGIVTQRIHIYHDYKKRGDLAVMLSKIKQELRKLNKTKSFYLSVVRINSQMLPDNSTAQSLLHGIIEVEIKFN